MSCCDMGFLDAWGCPRIHRQGEVATISQFASAAPRQAQGVKAHVAGRFHGKNHVPGVAAGADPHGNVVLSPKGSDLLGKDLVKGVII